MSQFPIDESLVERADYAYNPHQGKILYACDCRKEVERLQEQVRVLRELLADMLLIAEHCAPIPTHNGSCGPESSCDCTCVDSANCAQMIRNARAVLAATEERP